MVALQWCVSFSVQFSHSVVSSSLPPHGLQHARLPCPSPTRRACSNSCPMSQWCHPTISSSAVPFSSCLQSFPASGSFPVSQLLTSCGQSIGASGSASVLLRNIQGWFPLGVTCLISLLSKGLSRVFSSTTMWFKSISYFFLYIVCTCQSQSPNSYHRPSFALSIHILVFYICVSCFCFKFCWV